MSRLVRNEGFFRNQDAYVYLHSDQAVFSFSSSEATERCYNALVRSEPNQNQHMRVNAHEIICFATGHDNLRALMELVQKLDRQVKFLKFIFAKP